MNSEYPRIVFERMYAALNFIEGGADFEKARALIPFVYYFLFFILFTHLEGLDHLIAQGGQNFAPLFPLFWATNLPFSTTATIVLSFSTVAALGAAFAPLSRIARGLAFFGFFEYHAFLNSFGSPEHQLDHWLWISFILIFLPKLAHDAPKDERKKFSLVVWTVQAYLLLTYSMAGIGKLIYLGIQFAHHQSNALSLDAGALYIASQLNLMGERTPLGPFIVDHPWIAWLPFLALLELQTFAFVAAFRPRLHRLWGLCLILFHLGTFFTMRAVFVAPSALLMVLLLASPFAPKASLRETIGEIPLFGRALLFWENLTRKNATSGIS